MDLSRPVRYRELDLNDVATVGNDTNLRGSQIDRAIWQPTQGVGYTEKRSQADGLDSSDVFLGGLRIQLQGTVFGYSRRDAWDRLADIRAACSPTSAFADSPGDRGYLPLEFEEPTNKTGVDDWPGGFRILQVLARPLAIPGFTFARDGSGGVNSRGAGIPFVIDFECKDPRLYVRDYTPIDFSGAVGSSGTVYNRGDYPSPLNVMLVVPASANAGSMTLTMGGSVMKITVPNSTDDQIVRYNGSLKVLTIESNAVEVLRMDCLSFLQETTHPLVPPGYSGYSFTLTGSGFTTSVGSRIWFHEAYA